MPARENLPTIDTTHGFRFSKMTQEQLDQIADVVKTSLLSRLDSEVDQAMSSLGINEEINEQDWQILVDLILS